MVFREVMDRISGGPNILLISLLAAWGGLALLSSAAATHTAEQGDMSTPDTTQLMPGDYVAVFSPPIDKGDEESLASELQKIDEIENVKVSADDSSLRFSVKEGRRLDEWRLFDAVKRAAPQTSLSEPRPDNSVSPDSKRLQKP